MDLCPDPEFGTRDDWRWCDSCSAVKHPTHIHGDPLEDLTKEELLLECRRLISLNPDGLPILKKTEV